MSNFTYDGETYELIEERLTFAEARAFEKRTGIPFQKMSEHRDSMECLQALLWISAKRRNPTLTFADLDDWEIDSIDFEDDGEADPTSAPSGESDSAT